MKTLFTVLFLTISSVCFCQNSSLTTEVRTESNTNDIVDETMKVNSTDFYSAPNNYDEGTNNPESTGSTKKIVNGKEIYVKESDINGLKITIISEPK